MFRVGFLFVLAIGLVHGDACPYVNTLDCKTRSTEVLCGTNGVSYDNNCYMAKAYCADNTIHKVHDGACATSTTPSPVHGNVSLTKHAVSTELSKTTAPTALKRFKDS
ncbi:uncharacterized protein LOC132744188 isoform X2 [Ruditapes philippinarum]|uniref:uncharacterized protein LOC132744188 isoform X2 n=1 Tax=Ruditapes philippinarum TaxID=129788 RepID=UPI00295BA2D5|nr:uncharacterized protein LOC132744188 isoform X2 [Ruditapes philippinarum]